MKPKPTFNANETLAAARSGSLKGAALRKAINMAEKFGNHAAANELKLYLVDSGSFAGDAAPAEVRERVAQGIGALMARGHPLSRTRQMLARYGVIETINRIARQPRGTKPETAVRSARNWS